jgi:hypothetical protein
MLIFFSLFLLAQQTLQGEIEIQRVNTQDLKINDCLLSWKNPLQIRLKHLFQNPHIFRSPQHLKQAGFDLLGKTRRGFMVASHPVMGNYLIKKFQDYVPWTQQMDNYLRRINGARRLREFIKVNHLKHIVVPQKWLYQLPEQFTDPTTDKKSYVLVVEKIDICSGGADPEGEIAKQYYQIDFDILRELCIVLYYFRGLDSGLQNMPFTHQNKIAFIDTEHWGNQRKGFLSHAMHYLSPDRQEYALAVFEELRAQDHIEN